MIEAIIILKNLMINILLKQNNPLFLRKTNSKNELNQEEIVVAIGMIINPTSLKNEILITIFKMTEINEI